MQFGTAPLSLLSVLVTGALAAGASEAPPAAPADPVALNGVDAVVPVPAPTPAPAGVAAVTTVIVTTISVSVLPSPGVPAVPLLENQVVPSLGVPAVPSLGVPALSSLGVSATPSPSPSTTSSAGLGNGGAGAGASGGAGPGGMTIDIINSWSSDLSVSYGSNAGGPSPVGNPTAGLLGSSTRVVVPTGWAGRVYVGPGPNVDPMGTKVEGSTTGPPDIDVSYVDGYSVPMTCSVENEAVAGCNIDLYDSAITNGLISDGSSTGCPGEQVGPVCYNPSNDPTGNGPAPAFFAPCVGAAYTFPNDNVANVGNLQSNHVVCCVGTSCAAPARQGHMPNAPSKRGAYLQPGMGSESSNTVVRRRYPGSGTLLASRHRKLHDQFSQRGVAAAQKEPELAASHQI